MDEVKLFEKLDKIIELLEVQIAMDENFDWMMGEPGKPISSETCRAWVEAKKKVLKDYGYPISNEEWRAWVEAKKKSKKS